MEVTYILNSGFLVKLGDMLLIFDDYADPTSAVDQALGNARLVYFFASHAHFDHFDTHILSYASKVTRYIFSKDIYRTKRGKLFPKDKTVFLPHYTEWQDANIKVTSYSSTDVGTCFLLETEGKSIFHAGDFNWWHWDEDTMENISRAKLDFEKQLERMKGLKADVAFFPVDGRLERSESWGAREFIRIADIKSLVAMHRVGYPAWSPPDDFFLPGCAVPIWSPTDPGETRIF